MTSPVPKRGCMDVVQNFLKIIELPYVSPWLNDDIRPLESRRRTWTFRTFHNFWLLVNCNISSYIIGSALIPLGLSWWQAIIVGFSAYCRSSWGLWGSQFPVWNRVFLSFIWYTWVGGQAFELILLSWDPNYEKHVHNTIPASTGMTSGQFVSYVLFVIMSLPVLWVKPHRLAMLFTLASILTAVFFIALLIWALATMGSDGFGDTLAANDTVTDTSGPNSLGWLIVSAITSTIGGIAAGILNQTDFSRMAKRQTHSTWGQLLPFPFYAIVSAVIGILVTAATQKRFNEALWNPPDLLARILVEDPRSGTRAAVFFSGLALVVSQMGCSIPNDALAGGMDLASVLPQYINIRRGAFIVAILSPIVNPWRLVNTATTFLTVLSGYAVFIAPMTGIMLSHYIVVCKCKLKIEDMYRGHSGSIYWHTWGINWRTFVAWTVGVAPCLPGFISAVNPKIKVSDGAIEMYYLSYVYGLLSSGAVLAVLHWVFPARRMDAFVNDPMSAHEVQELARQRWEVTMDQTWGVLNACSQSSQHDTEKSPEDLPHAV
ncbi:Uracil permease [Escovopsis weberi]|uniref:Uracil permease n=1 Tax=Escovopsis weberi TaxID=150374 RepID=A0A0M8N822_ESCWE|nr:Uracil permease [Escovopsis weberi]